MTWGDWSTCARRGRMTRTLNRTETPSVFNECTLNQVTVNLSTPQRQHSSSPFRPKVDKPIEQFDPGDRVTHTQHGLGRIAACAAAGVTVDFGSHQTWITSPFSGLSKL